MGAPGTTHEFDPYKQNIRELSDRIVEAQKPIRILDAIKWDPSIQEAFFKGNFRELPPIAREYYEKRPLPFPGEKKKEEFYEIERDIRRLLGQFNPIGNIMLRMCREYREVVRMLESRGTPEFSAIAQELYGSASDAFHAGDPTLVDLAVMLSDTLKNLDRDIVGESQEKAFTGEQAVEFLQPRLAEYFQESERAVRVMVSDGIVADAAAGGDCIKLRRDARFSSRDLRVMEIHEGWVHIGTTLNGLSQPVCTFLSKGPPSSTVTQEGLAILTEVIAFASFPARVRRLTNRVRAVQLAEAGGNFIEVFEFFRKQGFPEDESYANTTRVFRGSTPDGGPFTKDLCYNKGFVLIFNYIRLAIQKGLPSRIPLLFCGKTTLEDIRAFAYLVEEKVLEPPRYVPPQFSDMSALVAWLCYSNFIARLNQSRIEADYANIL